MADNSDETVFQFDPFDARQSFAVDRAVPMGSETVRPTVPRATKGKERTMPLAIYTSLSSPASSSAYVGSSSSMSFSPYTSTSPDLDAVYQQSPSSELHSPETEFYSGSGKGKQPKTFPMLPPLSFPDIGLDYGQDFSPTPGPSSYGTLYSPPPISHVQPSASDREISPPSDVVPQSLSSLPNAVPRLSPLAPITRCRSLSNLSLQYSPSLGSVSTAITAQATFGPSAQGNISRQLSEILDKRDNKESLDGQSTISKLDLQAIQREPGSCPPAWYTVAKPLDAAGPSPRAIFKGKSRSQSSPYPISALDIIPIASTDIFQPIPIVITNYFDLILPKELRLHILRSLIHLHEHDFHRSVREGRFTVAKASSSRSRWIGKDRGIRELFKLSRVSKSWQSLVFDGELWKDLDLRSFPGLPPAMVVRIVQSAGSFIGNLDLAGHVELKPDFMTDMTTDLCLTLPSLSHAHTQLTNINLQGCTGLTTRSLHHLLVRSKYLQKLTVKGLACVINTTCDIIANFCPNITSLNMSRCANMDGDGIRSLAVHANLRREHLKLKELRLSGLKYVSDRVMRELGRAAPYLEVLDLSYSRGLHNSALDEFVACDEGSDHTILGVDTVSVTARDLGRDTNDTRKYRRRVTRLRHLVLSSCVLLTDNACSNLAYSVPKLEFLELAGIGPDLGDDGLVRLIEQAPHLRRVDLEDATEITDAVLRALTPAVEVTTTPSPQAARIQPGHALQQLTVSYAVNLSDDAFLNLICNCPKLTVLEADNTRMGSTVLKEFVRLSKERKASNARIVAVDCRGITENLVKDLSPSTRPRLGWRSYDARKLGYLDARDEVEEDLKIGQDELDESRVVIKTFYSWQTVDAVKAAREKAAQVQCEARFVGVD